MKKIILGLIFSLLSLLSYSQISINESFEGSSTPTGWTYSGFDRVTSTTETPCSGSAAILSHLSSALPISSALYSAANSNGKAISISLKYRIVATDPSNPVVSGNFKVEYSQSGTANNFQLIGSQINVTSPSVSCQTFTGNVSENNVTGQNRFRITANNSGTGDWKLIIDDVVIIQNIPCDPPTTVDISNITASTAKVDWFVYNNPVANGYELYYNTTNTQPNSATIPTITGLSGTSTVINSLLSNKTYYLWMRSNCNLGISGWSFPKTFTTLCGEYPLPYNENFETTNLSSIPVCSKQEGTDMFVYPIYAGLGFSQGRTLGINVSSNTSMWWFTPLFNLQAGITYALKFKRGNSTIENNIVRLKVAYGTSASSTAMTNVLKDFTQLYSNSASETIYFTPSVSGLYNFGFNAYTSSGTVGGGRLYIDDINLDIAANCKIIENLSVNSITETTATVNWDASVSNPATGYDLYYSTNEMAPINSTTPTYIGISGLSKDLSSLLAGKKYYVWIRSRCSATEFSDWRAISFSTACPVSFTVPYTENFENSFAGDIPACTLVENLVGRNWRVYSYFPSNTYWPTKALYLIFGNLATNTWFYTHGIYLETGRQYKITYEYGRAINAGDKLKVAFGSSPNWNSMTNQLADYQTIPSVDQNSAQHIFTVPATGIYYFGFNGYSLGTSNFIAIDNINIVQNSVLAVENTGQKDDAVIYPNPFKDVLNISNSKDVKSIIINDLSGKLIKTLAPAKELYLEDLSKGIYMVSLQYKDGSLKTFKVMKK